MIIEHLGIILAKQTATEILPTSVNRPDFFYSDLGFG